MPPAHHPIWNAPARHSLYPYRRWFNQRFTAGDVMMKTLLSAVTAVALFVSAGAAMAQDDQEHHPAGHHHARAHHERAMHNERDDGMRGERTEHGGPPSSPREQAETERLNNQQLGTPR
jgi:hypothetical protein